MKYLRILCAYLVVLLGVLLLLSPKATAATYGSLTYTVSNGEAMVTDCDTSATGAITIPDTLGGYPVTAIGDEAFYGCTGLTSVTIPDSVTSIYTWVFAGCTNLTSIDFPDDVTIIWDGVVSDCTSLTEFTIPNGVTTIYQMAFSGCTSLTNITIPDSVTTIGDDAFRGCTDLTGIWVEENNPNYCSDRYGVLFNKNMSELIAAPGAIKSYTIPNGVTIIDSGAFSYCTGLTGIWVEENNPNYCSDRYGVVFTKNMSKLIAAPGAIKSYTIPGSVTTIGYYAFSGCAGLTSVTIPDSVTTVGLDAFSGCTNLTSITIGSGVKTISNFAFDSCTGMTTVYYAGTEAQWNKIGIGTGNTPLTSATRYYEWSGTDVSIFTYWISDGEAMVTDCNTSATGAITIPDTLGGYPVTTIGDRAFSSCRSLTSITIPDGVTAIASGAFSGCSSLTSITIPDGVTTIGDNAFSGCASLTSITIPDGVTTIGEWAFSGCTSLTSITIGANVKDLGYYLFYGSTNLTAICVAESNPYFVSDDKGVLFTSGMKTLVAVPGTLTEYRIPDTVITIGEGAFCGHENITSVTIPASVTLLEYNAIDVYEKNLTDVYIEDFEAWCNVKIEGSDGGGAFGYGANITSHLLDKDGTEITEVVFDKSLKSIPDFILSSAKNVTSVKIPNTITSIGKMAFYHCENLQSVIIPDSVTTTGEGAFYLCSSLTSITIPDSVTSIDRSAFGHCSSLTSITIPDSVTTIGWGAFNECTSLKTVYYTGTEAQWNEISIASSNTRLTDATIVYDWVCEHTFTDYVFNNNATCTQDGTETRTCTACGEQETRPVTGTATGHRFTDYISNNDATCVAKGTKTATCELCSQTDTVEDPDAIGDHVWNEGDYYPPTQKREGYTLFTCTLCGETKKVVDLPPAEIITHPVSVAVDSGETVQFTVQTGGVVASYKWEYRKIWKWFDTTMEGSNTDTLTVPATGARNGYDYRCVITFADGTVLISDAAELTVRTYLTITSNPNDQTVVLGYKGQFTAKAEGEGIRYQWQYKRPNTDKWYNTQMEGCTKATVYIETTTARDGYAYRCKITDVTGNVAYSDTATMRVLGFTSHPVEVFTRPDKTVTFTVTTTVTEGVTYQWQYRRSATASWTNTTMSGYDTACLTVNPAEKNGYEYRCVLIGAKNSRLESKGAALHVGEALVIEDQSMDCTVQVGKNVFLMVEATNVYTYRWQYARAGSNKWSDTTMEGATTATLKVQATAGRNGYQYRCILKGLDGTEIISDVITLTVK